MQQNFLSPVFIWFVEWKLKYATGTALLKRSVNFEFVAGKVFQPSLMKFKLRIGPLRALLAILSS